MRLFNKNPDRWELIGKTQDTKAQTTTLIFQNEEKTKHKTLKTEGLEPEGIEAVLNWVDRYGSKRLVNDGKVYVVLKQEPIKPKTEGISKLPIRNPSAKQ